MVNLFGILTALFLVVSSFLAWKNKEAYSQQIQTRKAEEELLKQNQEKLVQTRNEVTEAKGDLELAESDLATTTKELEEQTAALKDLESEIEDEKLEVESKKEELAELDDATKDLGDAEELVADVKDLQLDLSDLSANISLLESKRGSLDNTSMTLSEEIDTTRERISLYSKQKSHPDLRTTISQVFGSYGFVTVNGGDNAGVIKGSTLEVVRNSEVVAKLLVTTVEANKAAANIIPGSKVDDIALRSGDRIVAAN